ncbi:hypothetical protein G5V59_02205 [Nocardioides sp. W3-2-3]|uniref:hypothetical protein n=1 Tax=Nocardioides convexus TaxID=2712224 RepID=UPI0024188645|nr:hypothetical protein [Nocardioides convexus]NGZ99593.1 hypothetical protein [Nocardioides convexus]
MTATRWPTSRLASGLVDVYEVSSGKQVPIDVGAGVPGTPLGWSGEEPGRAGPGARRPAGRRRRPRDGEAAGAPATQVGRGTGVPDLHRHRGDVT